MLVTPLSFCYDSSMRSILFRLEDDLHDRLKAAASEDNRSVNGELTQAVETFLNDRDKIAHLTEKPGGAS